MANFNGVPTGDTPANSEAYSPESFSDTDDTARLPKLGEHANGSNSSSTPDTLPTTNQEQSSPADNNSERKSHLGRNLVIGGVAVVALAVCIGGFGRSGDSGGSAPNADNEQQSGFAIAQPEKTPQSSNGLSMTDIKNDLGNITASSDSIEVTRDYVDDWLCDNGYTNVFIATVNDANVNYIIEGAGSFYTRVNGRNSDMLEMYFTINTDDTINVSINDPSFLEGDGYTYSSSSIPTIDEAREIAAQNL